jgi:hypothetical protein
MCHGVHWTQTPGRADFGPFGSRDPLLGTLVALDFSETPYDQERGFADLMEIRFISSLTAEDENLIAPALLKAVAALVDQLPIAYTLHIETTGSQVFQHAHAGRAESSGRPKVRSATLDDSFTNRMA